MRHSGGREEALIEVRHGASLARCGSTVVLLWIDNVVDVAGVDQLISERFGTTTTLTFSMEQNNILDWEMRDI